jgi:hypothetical protein
VLAYNFDKTVKPSRHEAANINTMAAEMERASLLSTGALSKYNNHEVQFEKLMELPVELRERTYEESMLTDNFPGRVYAYRGFSPLDRKDMGYFLPAVCFTSRSERRISARVFIRNATFYLFSADDGAVI